MAMYRAPNLDAFAWQSPVKDKDLATPPGSPAKGDRYIVGPSATGAWATHDNQITYYNGATWIFLTMFEGMACWVEDENKVYYYNGTSWAEAGAGSVVGYTLTFLATTSAMADGQTYFFGGVPFTLTQLDGAQRVYIPKAGTIKCAYIHVYATTIGSGENISVYLRKNATTDTLIATVGNTSQLRLFINTGLSISVSQGDYVEIKIVCPTWATDPAQVRWSGVIYVE